MFLLVGLGNPGARYAHTRHNAGFLVVETLARENNVRFRKEQCQARLASYSQTGSQVLLAKPQTYMNLSGAAVSCLLRQYGVPLDRMLIIVDDLDLPLGALRLKPGGGSGGHHGLDSIIAALGTKAFPRLRLGVGRPVGETIDYVLEGFRPAELPQLEEAVVRAAAAVRTFIQSGLETAMNECNRIKRESP